MKNPQLLSLAANPNTPAPVLEKLAASTIDKRILSAIAKNPNSSPQLLIKLTGKYLKEIGKNPALELILLEQPDFIDRLLDEYEENNFYGRWQFPVSFLPFAVKSSKPIRRLAVIANPGTPYDILDRLTRDPNEIVKNAAQKQIEILCLTNFKEQLITSV